MRDREWEQRILGYEFTSLLYVLSTNRHVVYAPSSVNQYGSSLFPGVSDAIFSAVEFGGSRDVVWEQIDLVRIHILYASQIMNQQYEYTL